MRVPHDEHHEITISMSIREWRAVLRILNAKHTTKPERELANQASEKIALAVDAHDELPPWRTSDQTH